jgi:RNA polymerase sigma-70 factor (ECF subfamily)
MAGSASDERARIRRAQDGSVADLEALFRHHWPRAYRAAYLVVHDAAAAEDIAQESFLAAVRTLDRFDRRRPFGPWLHRIVVNRAIDWSRARALRRVVGEAPLAGVAAAGAPDNPHSRARPGALASLSPSLL